uniref:hypothetical protein n=1 Tax=Alistipes sp. TaxID=1872444 RepID=UPI004055C858
MLTQIIAHYMTTHRRLVIPQLGAFLRKNEQEELLFTEMLKRDDGVLLTLLREQGYSELEAQGMIDRFVFELRHTVESGAVFRADHLGLFARGSQSNLCFRYLPHVEQEGAQPLQEEPKEPSKGQAAESVATDTPAQESPVALSESEAPAEKAAELKEEELPTPPELQPEELNEEEPAPKGDGGAEEARRKIKALLGDHPPQPHTSSRPRPTDPSIKGLRYGKPNKSGDGYGYSPVGSTRRPDSFVILAVVAVLLALAAILYGYLSDRQQQREDPYYVGEEMPIDVDPATLDNVENSDLQP